MRVGILGGTFNPPHLGHLALAARAREELGLGRVLLVPAARPPHKSVEDDPGAEERLELCRLAAADSGLRLEVSDLELRRDGPSYTADTLALLDERLPDDELVLLLGGDAAAGLPSWHRPRVVLEHALIGFTARGEDDHERVRAAIAGLAPESATARLLPFAMSPVAISSSAVRRRVREGRGVGDLVPRAVEERIAARSLYRGGPDA